MSELLGFDFSERLKVSLHGVDWTLGLVPYGKVAQLSHQLDAAIRPIREARDAGDEAGQRAAWDSQVDAIEAAQREIVRWGVKGWSKSGPLLFESVEFAGKRYDVLTDQVVDLLSRVGAGALVARLAEAIRAANTLSEDDLKGFR